MRINHNISAMNTHRQMNMNTLNVSKSLEKLSSGLRINKSGDDAAGLSISEKMRGQIRGLNQASRNIQDGVSLIQTAEGALSETHALLQRGRELSVQAANEGTLTAQDKQALQDEIVQINTEINRIASTTHFNGITLLDRSATGSAVKQAVLDALPGMLEHAESLIQTHMGLIGDGADISIFLDDSIDGPGGTQAYVSAMINPVTNEGTNIEMHIDMSDIPTWVGPHGGSDAFNYLDRTIAHEMVHAVFNRALNMNQDLNGDGTLGDRAIPTWFNEGSAEYIKGGADRLWAEVQNMITGGATQAQAIDNIVNAVGDGQSWGGASLNYAAAYAATRFLDDNYTGGYSAFMTDLYNGGARDTSVDDVISASGVWTDMNDFIADFKGAAGQAFTDSLFTSFTPGGDVGAIGQTANAEDVIGNNLVTGTATDPMTGWNEIFPTLEGDESLKVMAGANTNQTLSIVLGKADAGSLGINNVDLVSQADTAITSFDNAIQNVSNIRSRLGALQNRLETAYNVASISAENTQASESRIRDVDMAKEMMGFTKNNILNQAAQAMLAQANQQPQGVLQLLR